MESNALTCQQGTPEWHKIRNKHFCASDAPIIMGVSPFQTRDEYINMKVDLLLNDGIGKPSKNLPHLKKGHELESKARKQLLLKDSLVYAPCVKTKGRYLASVDGYNGMNKCPLLEVKQGNDTNMVHYENDHILPLYHWQMVHQCLVFDVEKVLFVLVKETNSDVELLKLEFHTDRLSIDKLIKAWDEVEQEINARYKDLADKKVSGQLITNKKTIDKPDFDLSIQSTTIKTNINDIELEIDTHDVAIYINSLKECSELKNDDDLLMYKEHTKGLKSLCDHLNNNLNLLRDAKKPFDKAIKDLNSLKTIALAKKNAISERIINYRETMLENVRGEKYKEYLADINNIISNNVEPLSSIKKCKFSYELAGKLFNLIKPDYEKHSQKRTYDSFSRALINENALAISGLNKSLYIFEGFSEQYKELIKEFCEYNEYKDIEELTQAFTWEGYTVNLSGMIASMINFVNSKKAKELEQLKAAEEKRLAEEKPLAEEKRQAEEAKFSTEIKDIAIIHDEITSDNKVFEVKIESVERVGQVAKITLTIDDVASNYFSVGDYAKLEKI